MVGSSFILEAGQPLAWIFPLVRDTACSASQPRAQFPVNGKAMRGARWCLRGAGWPTHRPGAGRVSFETFSTIQGPGHLCGGNLAFNRLPGLRGSLTKPQEANTQNQNASSLTYNEKGRDPWVAQRFGACLWPRARSWRPGFESHVRLPVHGACFSLCLCLCLSLSLCDYHK